MSFFFKVAPKIHLTCYCLLYFWNVYLEGFGVHVRCDSTIVVSLH